MFKVIYNVIYGALYEVVYGVIYKITNTENGKIYIGQTTRTVEERFQEHMDSPYPIGSAIRKHGVDKFTVEVIALCASREELDAQEIRFIAEYDCMTPKGYNCKSGGEGGTLSEETKAKISEIVLAYNEAHPEVQEKKSAAMKKHFENPEAHERASAASKEAAARPGVQEKKSASMKKFYEDPEKRAERSAIMIEYYRVNGGPKHSEETKAKISRTLTGRTDSEEVKQRKRSAQKARRARERIAKLLSTIAAENLSAANLPAEVFDSLKKFHAANPDAVTKAYELRKKSQAARTEKRSKQSIKKAQRKLKRIAKMSAMVAQQNLSAANLPAKIEFAKLLAKTGAKNLHAKTASTKYSEGQRRRFERQEERDKIAAAVTERFSDPAEREAQSKRIKAAFQKPGVSEAISARQQKRFEDPAERKKVSDGLKKYFEENGTRKQSQDTRDKISVKRKAYWRRVRIAKLLPTITAENLSAANLPAEISDGLKKFHAANPDAVTKAYELRKKSQATRTERRIRQAIAQKARRARERVAKLPLLVAQQNLSAANLPAKIALP